MMNNNYNSKDDNTRCTCWRMPQQALPTPCTTFSTCRRNTGARRHRATCTSVTSSTFLLAAITVISTLFIGWKIPVRQPFVSVDAFTIIDYSQVQLATRPHRLWTATTTATTIDRQRQDGTSPFSLTSPSSQRHSTVKIHSNVAIKPQSTEIISDSNENGDDKVVDTYDDIQYDSTSSPSSTIITSEEVKLRIEKQLERLKLKDRMSPKLSKEELEIVYEDDHLMIVNKPAGVLTVAGKDKTNNSFVQAVYDSFRNSNNIQVPHADHMVVHRLGMDVSGLLILAKNIDTVRKLHTHFRTRDVERTYEALVCGHVIKNKGRITLPLMRDYEHPLYVRVSTDQHQEVLIDLDPDVVGKKLLEQPKECITEYKVLSREELNGQPVTRLLLRSVSGRMHQLNCHLAAIGHPIVGDLSYGGINGMAAPNGGLSDDELDYMIPKAFSLQSNNRVTKEQLLRTTTGSRDESMPHIACHAKTLRFRHPISKKYVTFEADAPF